MNIVFPSGKERQEEFEKTRKAQIELWLSMGHKVQFTNIANGQKKIIDKWEEDNSLKNQSDLKSCQFEGFSPWIAWWHPKYSISIYTEE